MTAVAEITQSAAWRAAAAQAATRNRHQRALVLRYPDIAKRLTEPPARFADPAQWSGYIPGYWGPEDRTGRVQPNTSPVRGQLAEILQAAAERSDRESAGSGDLESASPDTAPVLPPWRPR